jgi:hypothetical protein
VAAVSDSSALSQHFDRYGLVSDLIGWLAHHGATWEPREPGIPSLRILIHVPGEPDVTATPGDTLTWDGRRVVVTTPPGA